MSADDRRLRVEFDALDTNKDGNLSPSELKAGLRLLKLPYEDPDVQLLLDRLDADKNGLVSFDEFRTFVLKRERKLRALFDELDTNRNGVIDSGEVVIALQRLNLPHDDQAVQALLSRVDKNRDGTIGYDEWRELLVLLPKANIEAAFGYWQRAAVLDIGDEVVVPHGVENDSMSASNKALINFVAGATASLASKTSTAPLERYKIMAQLSTSKQPGLFSGLAAIFRTEGVSGLFRGNLLNLMKSAPENAVKFMVFEQVKRLFAEQDADLTVGQLFLAGAAGGVGAHASCYPLEVLKTRVCAAKAPAPGLGTLIPQMWAEGGIRPFYRGMTAVLASAIPHSGFALGTYQVAKDAVEALHPDREPGVTELMACATVSSLTGQLVSYPLHVVKARLIMQGTAGSETQYKGTVHALKHIMQHEGLPGMFRGFMPSLLKGVPSHCITYVVYEYFRRAWGAEKSHKKKH
eukprot:TRINITY_DN11683_c0_g1_i1.p1 TRINITY_DN11683_c0_g1~~TRINITY_DN11683_c0_g1_i1.p1  ORF type:complete len:464 (-),score=103.62 TRINITY_DN11683_c0_g1_i1:2-1393(-)